MENNFSSNKIQSMSAKGFERSTDSNNEYNTHVPTNEAQKTINIFSYYN